MYIALTRFADLQDGNRIYEAGEIFPRLGFVVSDERLAELAGSDNRAGKPLIEAVEAPQMPVERADAKGIEIPADKQKNAVRPRRSRKKG